MPALSFAALGPSPATLHPSPNPSVTTSQTFPVTGEPQPEVWADVAGFVGLYQVSNLGRIASFRARGGRRPRNPHGAYLLNPGVSSWGYVRVDFSINNLPHVFKVHILVARAFVPNPDGKPEVNHIDFDKTNNRATNLEWATGPENMAHYHKARVAGTHHSVC